MSDPRSAADGKQESLPKPLQEVVSLLDRATQAEEVLEQVSQKLNLVLLNSGVGIGVIQKNTAGLSESQDIDDLRKRVIGAYSASMSPSNVAHNSVSIVPRMRDDVQVRIALSALRESSDFETLKREQIWNLPVLELKTKLENTHYNEKCHWYMIIIRIMRFREPNAVTGGVIAAAPLRHFLCDYVFGVPRPEFTDKRRIKEPNVTRIIHTSPRTDKSPTPFEFVPPERPKFEGIPEEQTGTYNDLLAWLRLPENEHLVASLESKVKTCRGQGRMILQGSDLSATILEGFRPGFPGRAVLLLAEFLKPGQFLQDFIAEIRPVEPSLPKTPSKPAPAPHSSQPSKSSPQVPHKPPRFTAPQPVGPAVVSPPVAPISHAPVCPNFTYKSDAIAWLKGKPEYGDLIKTAAKEKGEKSISVFLVRNEGSLLLRILFKMKEDCGLESIADIVHHVFPEESKLSIVLTNSSTVSPVHTSPIPSEPISVTDVGVDEGGGLQITPEHEITIRALVQLHQDKKYREFWNGCQALAGTPVLAEIQEVKETFQHRSLLQSIFFIAGQEITEKEKDIYRQHHWSDRIVSFPGVASQLQKLLDHKNNKSMKVLQGFLEDVKIFIPLKRVWQGLEEKELEATEAQKKEREKENYREPNLFDVVVSLVRTRKTYQKKDEESTKKLLRVVKQIVGREEITADDEDKEESE